MSIWASKASLAKPSLRLGDTHGLTSQLRLGAPADWMRSRFPVPSSVISRIIPGGAG
jgi:hypothetical protein